MVQLHVVAGAMAYRESEVEAGLNPGSDNIRVGKKHSLLSGVMAEQVHPHSGIPLSVSPVTLSHGTFAMAVNEFADRFARLK